eukprot:244852_1
MTYENGSDEENSSYVQMIQSMELQSTTAKFDGLSEQHNEVGLCDILRIDSDTLKQMVAAQHEQKTEYESKALEFTRLHEELKVLKVFSEIDADADAD